FRAVRARKGETYFRRRNGTCGPGNSLRCVCIRRFGAEDQPTVSSERNRQTNRSLEKAGAGTSRPLMRVAGAIDIRVASTKGGVVAEDGGIVVSGSPRTSLRGGPAALVAALAT